MAIMRSNFWFSCYRFYSCSLEGGEVEVIDEQLNNEEMVVQYVEL